jgi:hypothetical protein
MFLTTVCCIVFVTCLWQVTDWYRAGTQDLTTIRVPGIIGTGLGIYLAATNPMALLLVVLLCGGYDYLIRGKRIKR